MTDDTTTAEFSHPGLTHRDGQQCVWIGDCWWVPTAAGEGYECSHLEHAEIAAAEAGECEYGVFGSQDIADALGGIGPDTTPAPPDPSTSGEPGVGLRARIEALADEAVARMKGYPSHPHWGAWSMHEHDLREALAASEADRAGGGREALDASWCCCDVMRMRECPIHGEEAHLASLIPATPLTADVGLTDEEVIYDWLIAAGYHGHYPSAEEAAKRLADALAARTSATDAATQKARVEGAEEALRGVRWRVETACDGYANLADSDVPESVVDFDDYMRGAEDAARAIREVLNEPARADEYGRGERG